MPRGQKRDKPTREELTTRLRDQRDARQAKMDANALEAQGRAVQRHVQQSMVPDDATAAGLSPQSKANRMGRARSHSAKLRDRALTLFEAAEQIDARVAELEAE